MKQIIALFIGLCLFCSLSAQNNDLNYWKAEYAAQCQNVKNAKKTLDNYQKLQNKAFAMVNGLLNKQNTKALEEELLLLLSKIREEANKPLIIQPPCLTGDCD